MRTVPNKEIDLKAMRSEINVDCVPPNNIQQEKCQVSPASSSPWLAAALSLTTLCEACSVSINTEELMYRVLVHGKMGSRLNAQSLVSIDQENPCCIQQLSRTDLVKKMWHTCLKASKPLSALQLGCQTTDG